MQPQLPASQAYAAVRDHYAGQPSRDAAPQHRQAMQPVLQALNGRGSYPVASEAAAVVDNGGCSPY